MKRGLQIVLVILSLVPAGFGLLGMAQGVERFVPGQSIPELDSQFRFLSAYYFGLALLIWWIIPNVERHTTLFRTITSVLFLGGVARLYSYLTVGAPPTHMVAGMVLELCLPILILWQKRVADLSD